MGMYNEALQEKLVFIILKLSKCLLANDEDLQAINIFEEIYDKGSFIYKKSIISKTIYKIQIENNNTDLKENDKLPVDILKCNFDIIINNFKSKSEKTEIYEFIFNLYDYICIEVYKNNCNNKYICELTDARTQLEKSFNDMDMRNKLETASKHLQKSNETLIKAKQQLDETNNKLIAAQKTADRLQSQVIAILGIFSAITISIFSSLSLFSSVFNNLNNVGKFKLSFFTLLIGFVIFNIVSLLFSFLSTLFKGDPGKKLFLHKLIILVNLFLLAFMFIIIILWLFSQKIIMPIPFK